MRVDLQAPVTSIKGVGTGRAKQLEKLGIKTLEDACLTIPRSYQDRTINKTINLLQPGDTATLVGSLTAKEIKTTSRKGMKIYQIVLDDTTGRLLCKWFRINQKLFQETLKKGTRLLVSGKVEQDRYSTTGRLSMMHPDLEVLGEDEQPDGGIVPVYPGTAGLSPLVLQKIIRTAVTTCSHQLSDPLPESLRRKYAFPDLAQALQTLHFPPPEANLDQLCDWKTAAHQRLAYEEFFLLELGITYQKQEQAGKKEGISFTVDKQVEKRLSLPFDLTAAQKKVLAEILADLASPQVMYRLLQGDVGSGKTVIALLAAFTVVANDYQVAIMAPTEILADQHYQSMSKLLSSVGISTALLTGGVTGKKKKALLEQIATGAIQVIIGTQAVIQKGVSFHQLGLSIIDEQHRFGVLQRATIQEKGKQPDLLVMTATPIPRSLALTVYGDLSLSVIDELPPGRQPITTTIILEQHRDHLYHFMEKEMKQGGQGFVVCPLVEESEKQDLKNATDMGEQIQLQFPSYKVGLIHGRLKRAEKEAVMEQMRSGSLQLLVATTVIEVGIDIPDATFMLIEHAERFGLAQMHQLRGRIGRGKKASYCFLGAYHPISDIASSRLRAMVKHRDGFRLADEDLRLRGPGDFLGTRQTGLPHFKVANIIKDVALLEHARSDAQSLLTDDPSLRSPDHRELKMNLQLRWAEKLRLYNIG